MKNISKILLVLFVVYAIIVAFFSWIFCYIKNINNNENNIAVNRIHAEISESIVDYDNFDLLINKKLPQWQSEYKKNCPDSIVFIYADSKEKFLAFSDNNNIICGLYDKNKNLVGFVQYVYYIKNKNNTLFVMICAVFVALIINSAVCIYIYFNIIEPFNRLAEYPERLARLHTKEKLPENKSRYFGKYIWGMNMLCDMLEDDRKRINRLEYERQTLLVSLAHGVKTPVANIKLYAQAMKMGMYKDEGINEVAGKIESNTEKLEKITVEMLETSATSVSAYNPQKENFYLNELSEMIENEFSNRLKMKKIAYSIDIKDNLIVENDKWAIFRAVAQLIENAVKYGNGEGIFITAFKEDDELCISVKNKGNLLPENELSYVFKSYWRGSNAENVEGSGIGLYTAREVIKTLGGSIFVRRLEESSEMEFIICLDNF